MTTAINPLYLFWTRLARLIAHVCENDPTHTHFEVDFSCKSSLTKVYDKYFLMYEIYSSENNRSMCTFYGKAQ